MHALQRLESALDQLGPAVNEQNPGRPSSAYLQGMLHSALGEHEKALEAFERAESLGLAGERRAYAETYAALRRFDDAERIRKAGRRVGLEAVEFEQRLADISFPLDQGRWDEALAEAAEAASSSAARHAASSRCSTSGAISVTSRVKPRRNSASRIPWSPVPITPTRLSVTS